MAIPYFKETLFLRSVLSYVEMTHLIWQVGKWATQCILCIWIAVAHQFIAVGNTPDSKVHGTNMGPIWGRQDPGGPDVGPMNFAIWDVMSSKLCSNAASNTNKFRCYYTFFNTLIKLTESDIIMCYNERGQSLQHISQWQSRDTESEMIDRATVFN